MFSAAEKIDEFLSLTTQNTASTAPAEKAIRAREEWLDYSCDIHGAYRRPGHDKRPICPICRDMKPSHLDRLQHIIDRAIRQCATHGRFVSKHIQSDRTDTWTDCPECVIERQRKIDTAAISAEREITKVSRLNRLNGLATIPPLYENESLDTFEAKTKEQAIAKKIVTAYIEKFDQLNGRGFIMHGTPGTGKSHLCYAIVRELQRRGHSALSLNLSQFFGQFKATFGVNDIQPDRLRESDVFAAFTQVDLLILDEVGQEGDSLGGRELSAWRHSTLFDVIDARNKACRPTCLVSNKNFDELRTILGVAMFSRINQNQAILISVHGEDYRGRG